MIFTSMIRKHIIPVIFVIFAIFFAYAGLVNTYFQQDEWQFFAGNIYYESKGIIGILESFLPVDALSHVTPLSMAYLWGTYVLFGTNFTPHAYLSIVLHALNALLLYYFVFIWLKNRTISFIAALFFGLNSIPSQSVTWVAGQNSYEIPVFFILLSLIFFQKFLRNNIHRKINIFLSLVMLFVSLLFHENAMFLFLFYPLIFLLDTFSDRKKILHFFSYTLALFALAFFLVRLPFFFGFITSLPERSDISHPSVSVYPYRMMSKSLKSFAGSFIPEKTLIHVSDMVIYLGYPQFLTNDRIPNPFIAQSIVFDLVSYVLTILIILAINLFRKRITERKLSNALRWSLLFVITSFLPYSFVLGRPGYASILEPKFFYVGGIGISIIVAVISYYLILGFSKRKILRTFIYLLLGLYFMFHLLAVKSNIDNLVEIGMRRKAFVNTITSAYKTLPQRVVFYVQSDTAYYGMPDNEKILPVQVGFGKILMIMYQKDEHFPGCLYEGQFLLAPLEVGYRYCDGRGFGFIRTYESLLQILKENKLDAANVIAYSWNGKTKQFVNMTDAIQTRVAQDIWR